jgi:hypothetical protein
MAINIPNDHKIFQMTIKCSKSHKIQQMTTEIPKSHKIYQMTAKYVFQNGHKICQHFLFQGLPLNTQIGTFGMGLYPLATLLFIWERGICRYEIGCRQGDQMSL